MLVLLAAFAFAGDARFEVRTAEDVVVAIDGQDVAFAQDGRVAARLVDAGTHTVAIRDAAGKKTLFSGSVEVTAAGLECQWSKPPGGSTLAFFCG